MYFEWFDSIPLIINKCYMHNISELQKALKWAKINKSKNDIEKINNLLTQEQTKLNEENSMTSLGKFIKRISYKKGGANV